MEHFVLIFCIYVLSNFPSTQKWMSILLYTVFSFQTQVYFNLVWIFAWKRNLWNDHIKINESYEYASDIQNYYIQSIPLFIICLIYKYVMHKVDAFKL